MNLKRVVLALALGLTLAWPATVLAAEVAILSSPAADCALVGESNAGPDGQRERACLQQIEETVTRLSAELATAGFRAVSITRPPHADSDLGPSSLGLLPIPVGVFSVTQIEGVPTIEAVLTDRSTLETLRFTLRADPHAAARAPALLAVRALELVRANALVLELSPPAQPTQPLSTPSVPQAETTATVLPPAPFTWHIAAAAAMFYGFESLGPAVAPMLTASVTTEHRLGLQVLGAGPSRGPSLRGRAGRATVREALTGLAFHYRMLPLARLGLVFSLGVGAHHLSVQGTAREPFVAARQQVWSPLALAGLGTDLRLARRVSLSLDLRAFATFSRLVVHVAEQAVGAVSRPSTLTALGLCVEL